MAGTENDLNMDMIQIGDLDLPDNLESLPEKEETEKQSVNNIVTDGENQEIVGDGSEKSLEEKEESTVTSPANSDDNVFTTVTEFLSERGLLSIEDDEVKAIKSEDDFAELVKKQIKSNELSDLNDNQKKYLEAIRVGVPDEVFHTHLQSTQAYEELTDEVIKSDPGIRKSLIIEGLKAQGFKSDYALRHFNRVSESNEEVEEATMFRDKLKQIQDSKYQEEVVNTKKVKEQAEVERQQQLDNLKKSVYEKDKLFEDFSITKGIQDKVYELMTKPIAHAEDGTPINALMKDQIENPVKFQTDLYYAYLLTNGFKDFKKLMGKATTKAVNNFKDKLHNSNFITTSQSNPSFLSNDSDIPEIADIVD